MRDRELKNMTNIFFSKTITILVSLKYEQVDYSIDDEPEKYWFWMFEKEFENFDWLYDHFDWLLEDEEISKEVCETGQKMIEDGDSVESIVNYCIAEGVL